MPNQNKISFLIFSLFILIFSLVFIGLHFLLRRVPDVAQPRTDRLMPIFSTQSVTQEIAPRHDGLSTINIYLRNARLQNIDPLIFSLADSGGQEIRRINISGRNIGDGDDIRFQFPTIPNSANQSYTITLSAPKTPYSGPLVEAGFSAAGSLAYRAFYHPENYFSLISQSHNHLISLILIPRYLFILLLFTISLFIFSSRLFSNPHTPKV